MKKDRSDIYTTGLCDIIDSDRNKRVCFFEIDGFNALELYEVLGRYYYFDLDVLVHRTGKGFHFLSPTMVDLEIWKEFHNGLRHINSECPMTCLRIEPNKWEGEDMMWKNAIIFNFNTDGDKANIQEYCEIFREKFNTLCASDIHGAIKIQRYPLPTQVNCTKCNEKFDKIKEKEHICVTR